MRAVILIVLSGCRGLHLLFELQLIRERVVGLRVDLHLVFRHAWTLIYHFFNFHHVRAWQRQRLLQHAIRVGLRMFCIRICPVHHRCA